MDYADKVFRKLEEKGVQEAAVQQEDSETRQIRFSENGKDLYNIWNESHVSVFASKGKRIVSMLVKDYGRIDEITDQISKLCDRVPESPEFMGISPHKHSVGKMEAAPLDPDEVSSYVGGMISGAREAGADRSSGVVYRRHSSVHLRTTYNDAEYQHAGTELVVRSFHGESTGQESYHFGSALSELPITPESIGRSAGETATAAGNPKQGDNGKFTVLMSPYVVGNILSYSGGFLSSHMVRTGLSCFQDMIGKEVASEEVTLIDDPTDYTGEGARPVDDEGTPTRKNTLIRNGKLETYLHSYSTGKLDSEESTGNAGIISPSPWQLRLQPGKESFETMLSGIEDGLFINNAWYTRFQDYRNGTFSTVPRDGVFRIKDGKIVESWSGIRISESILNILKNIRSISRETKHSKWWLEIEPSIMPYVLVDNVNITKSF